MKKYLKDIVLVVVTAIIASGVGVAAYNYNANNIEYSPSDKTWKVSTVAEAINSLVNDTRTSVMNYSTDEQVVGTWIDGSPIYQRTWVVNFNVTSNGNWETIVGISAENTPNIKQVILASCYRTTDTAYSSIDARYYNGRIQVMFPNSGILSNTTGLTLQYTKATDTGSSNNS